MSELEVALVEWPEGRDNGGPRLLGMSTDPDLVARVRELLLGQRRREMARLGGHLEVVDDTRSGGDG